MEHYAIFLFRLLLLRLNDVTHSWVVFGRAMPGHVQESLTRRVRVPTHCISYFIVLSWDVAESQVEPAELLVLSCPTSRDPGTRAQDLRGPMF